MPDREKVIRGFECCLRNDHKKCPYYSADILDTTCYTRLHTDVLALLKEQGARVMTLEETIALCDEPVWIEEDTLQGSYGEWGVVKGLHVQYKAVNIGGVRFGLWPIAKYNISWRCWTERPTEEQRKAVKWEDDDAY